MNTTSYSTRLQIWIRLLPQNDIGLHIQVMMFNVMTLLHDGEHAFQVPICYLDGRFKHLSLHKMVVLCKCVVAGCWAQLQLELQACVTSQSWIHSRHWWGPDVWIYWPIPSDLSLPSDLSVRWHTAAVMKPGPSLGWLPGETDNWGLFYVHMWGPIPLVIQFCLCSLQLCRQRYVCLFCGNWHWAWMTQGWWPSYVIMIFIFSLLT